MSNPLGRLVGTWSTEATHPSIPGVVVNGTSTFEWLEGEHFLILRARSNHPDFPDSISVIGHTDRGRAEDTSSGEPMHMHYFDSRGVSRVYTLTVDESAVRIERLDPAFAQRFTGTFTDDGTSFGGVWQVSEHGGAWTDDLEIRYRRVAKS